MSSRKKPPPSSESTLEHSLFGSSRARSKPLKPLQDSADTISNHAQLVLELFGQPFDKAQGTQSFTLLVSSRAQQPDLNRQVAALVALYPDAEVISEIGGGLNFKRKKLQALLERVMQRTVRRIVVAHKDRFARFGFDHFRWLCEQHGCEIVVLNETALSPEREMVEDIQAILHRSSSRLYGLHGSLPEESISRQLPRKYKSQVSQDPDLPKS